MTGTAGDHLGLLLDCDGVLADTLEANFAAYSKALRAASGGVSMLSRAQYGALHGRSWRQWLGDLCDDPAAVHRDKVRRYPEALRIHARVLPGMALLRGWAVDGRPVAIVSNASEASVRAVLKVFDSEGLAAAVPVMTPTGRYSPKPSPQMLIAAAARIGMDRAVLIDDNFASGAAAARGAGMGFVHADGTTGWPQQAQRLLSDPTVGTVGVVAAAGAGRRLAHLAGPFGKPLVQVGGRSVLSHSVRSLQGLVREIVTVAAPSNVAAVRREVARAIVDEDVAIHTVVQIRPTGLADALRLAVEAVGGDRPIVLVCADNVIDPDDASAIARSVTRTAVREAGEPTSMAWTSVNHPHPTARRLAVLDPERPRLLEKPLNPPSNRCWCGPVGFRSSQQLLGIIDIMRPSSRGELEIVDVLNHYLANECVEEIPARGMWFDVGTERSLAEARAAMGIVNPTESRPEDA